MQMRLLSGNVKQQFVPGTKVWHYVPKQRCSPRWALKRQYLNGVTDGLEYHYKAPSIAGYPKWIVRRAVKDVFGVLKSTIKGKSREAFAAKAQLYSSIGILRGARMRATADVEYDKK